MTGTLYIVATPIGNLTDTSERSKTVLGSVDFILAEDTRVTLKLLSHFQIKKKIYSYSEHSSDTKDTVILENLQQGMSYALVSDAGTPSISDPGARLIQKVIAANITVVPIPGPSAVTTLLSVFGPPQKNFHFWGYFPEKLKRQTELMHFIDEIPGIHVFFESPYRVIKVLEKYFASRDDFYMVVGREMTKQFETFYRGTPSIVLESLKADMVKGEFCVGVLRHDRI